MVMDIPKHIEVVAIQNYGRSGAMFLNSIFDQHPNILTMPAIHNLWLYAFIDQLIQSNKELNDEEIINNFTSKDSNFSGWFYPHVDIMNVYNLNRVGEYMNRHTCINVTDFKRHFLNIMRNLSETNYRKKFFIAIHLSYGLTIGRQLKKKMVILFQSHCQPKRYIEYLIQDFPNVRFVHLVRMPCDAFESYLRFLLYRGFRDNILLAASKVMLKGYNLPNRFEKDYIPGYSFLPYFDYINSITIRLEDLHVAPKDTISGLCQWMNIPWDNCLESSTFNGEKWWNSPESIRISGFNSKFIDKKSFRLLNRFDVYRLNLMYQNLNQTWGYSPVKNKSELWSFIKLMITIWWPFKSERSLHRYHKDAQSHELKKVRFQFVRSYIKTRWAWIMSFRQLQSSRVVPLLKHFVRISNQIHQQEIVFKSFRNEDISYLEQKEKRKKNLQEGYKLGANNFSEWIDQLCYYGRSFGLYAQENRREQHPGKIVVCCETKLFNKLIEPVLQQFGLTEIIHLSSHNLLTDLLTANKKVKSTIMLIQEDWTTKLIPKIEKLGYIYGYDYFQLPGLISLSKMD